MTNKRVIRSIPAYIVATMCIFTIVPNSQAQFFNPFGKQTEQKEKKPDLSAQQQLQQDCTRGVRAACAKLYPKQDDLAAKGDGDTSKVEKVKTGEAKTTPVKAEPHAGQKSKPSQSSANPAGASQTKKGAAQQAFGQPAHGQRGSFGGHHGPMGQPMMPYPPYGPGGGSGYGPGYQYNYGYHYGGAPYPPHPYPPQMGHPNMGANMGAMPPHAGGPQGHRGSFGHGNKGHHGRGSHHAQPRSSNHMKNKDGQPSAPKKGPKTAATPAPTLPKFDPKLIYEIGQRNYARMMQAGQLLPACMSGAKKACTSLTEMMKARKKDADKLMKAGAQYKRHADTLYSPCFQLPMGLPKEAPLAKLAKQLGCKGAP